jgi:hypothetical protein
MDLFVFSSSDNEKRFGFTADRAGANLPVAYGPWRSWRPVEPTTTPWRDYVADIRDQDTVVRVIKSNGYCVTDAGRLVAAKYGSG